MKVTEFLAVWGAVVSTIAILWNVYRDVTDRGKLRVVCYLGNMVTPGGSPDPNDYLVWRVANAGLQPVVVTHVGGALAVKHFMITPHASLPKTLQPGEYFLEYTADLSALDHGLRFLAAWDSLNRTYKITRKNQKQVQAEYLKAKQAKSSSPQGAA